MSSGGRYFKRMVINGLTNISSEDLGEISSEPCRRKRYSGYCTSLQCCEKINGNTKRAKSGKIGHSLAYYEKRFKTDDEKQKLCQDCGTVLLWFGKTTELK